MANETERRFLVQSDEWREMASEGVEYRQGYLSTDPKRNVRVRVGKNKANLTIKGKAKGLTRPEFEYSIPLQDSGNLEQLCHKPILTKRRYTLRQDGLTWEIDEYAGPNRGLIVAEVETNGPIRELPKWLGAEISADERYRNYNLVEHPFSSWKEEPQKPDIKYHFVSGEKLPDSIHRILQEQLSAAIDELSNAKESIETAVHEARKCVKRARSVLRLIRPVISDRYDGENRRLQEVGRKLSEMRDAQALVETLLDLEKKQTEDGANHANSNKEFKTAHAYLRGRKNKLVAAPRAKSEMQVATGALQQSLKTVQELQLDNLDFSIVLESIKRTMKRGRKAFSGAYADPTAANFHEFRKRVKDLRYQLSLVSEMWSEVLEAYSKSAKNLEQYLGEDHNLAVLADVLKQAEALRGNGSQNMQKLIAKKQKKLRGKAHHLADRLYSESLKSWTRRLETSWDAWQAESS